MEQAQVSFAKIVATPTPTDWSQAYHAGSLFATFSLSKKNVSQETLATEQNEPQQKDQTIILSVLGKELINTLEEEYFTLETKTLDSIKTAVTTVCEKIPDTISASVLVAALSSDIVYIFAFGTGKILIKRDQNMGVLLNSSSKKLVSASGRLLDSDIIILESEKFAKLISDSLLFSSLQRENPTEITETLSPKIHEKEEGDACFISIIYHKKTLPSQEEIEEEIKQQSKTHAKTTSSLFPIFSSIAFPKLPRLTLALSHSKKLFLTIAIVLTIALTSSIYFSMQKQTAEKKQTQFNELFIPAQKKYDEGQSLISLNKNLAYDDFKQAKDLLGKAKPQFRENSNETKQIDELLKKVVEGLQITSSASQIQPKTVESTESALLEYEYKDTNSQSYLFTQDEKTIYVLTNAEISSIDKTSRKQKQVVKNDSLWKEALGFGTYLGNFYVADAKANQILKFTPSNEGFSKSFYFLDNTSANLSQAASLTIDGSIYVLFKNGSIKKFTKGKEDSFLITSLEKPLSNPSKISTHIDFSNLYILDSENSRIVALNKNGAYQSQYQAGILKDALDFEILEKDKKIFVLSKSKIWQIDLK